MSVKNKKSVQIPYHIATAKVSPRAKEVWTMIAFESDPDAPEVLVNKRVLAEKLGCAPSTIARAIKILIAAGLMVEAGRKSYCRCCKYYALLWEKIVVKTPADPTEGEALKKIIAFSAEEKTAEILRLLYKVQEYGLTIKKLRNGTIPIDVPQYPQYPQWAG